MANRRELLTWIDAILRQTGWTATELARQADIHGSTLTRFLRSEEAPLLSGKTQEKLRSVAARLGIGAVSPIGPMDAGTIERAAWDVTHRLLTTMAENGLADITPTDIDSLTLEHAKLLTSQLMGTAEDRHKHSTRLNETVQRLQEIKRLGKGLS